jgi:hypothetical protein
MTRSRACGHISLRIDLVTGGPDAPCRRLTRARGRRCFAYIGAALQIGEFDVHQELECYPDVGMK